jgi:hypothetical protein
MHVTQSIESNVNILANSPLRDNIASILKGMPFDHFICKNITDAFMIPCFVLLLDGSLLTKGNSDIDIWECYLVQWEGRLKKCTRCKNYNGCHKSAILGKDIDTGPKREEPVILLNADKKQQEVEGLVALIPPMPVNDPISHELEEWIKLTCLVFHQKTLKWRKEYNKWHTLKLEKDASRPKTFREIADRKWRPKNITVELPSPELD